VLPLDSPRWAELTHAYGSAENAPERLRELKPDSISEGPNEPWFWIWSALAHQGDVYSASFAAVPHVVRVLSIDPANADHSFLQFPAWVEICRQKGSVPISDDLQADYFSALAQLPSLAVEALQTERDEGFIRCALSAIAAAKNQITLAEAILDFSPDVADIFNEWLEDR